MGPTPSTSLKVVAHITAKPGKRDELEEALLALIEPTRAEDACQEYEMFISTEDDSVFTFVETWTSPETLDRHLNTPHLQGFLARAEELVEGAPQILTMKLRA